MPANNFVSNMIHVSWVTNIDLTNFGASGHNNFVIFTVFVWCDQSHPENLKIFWFLTIVFSCQQSFWCLFWRTLPLIWAAQKYGPYIPNYIKSAYNKTPPCCRWNHRSFHSQSNNKYWRWLDCLTQQKGTEPARRITRNTFKRI